MSFIKLVNYLSNANDEEAKIIHYIIDNSQRVIINKLTLSEVSKACYTARTSLLRIMKKFGFKDWTNFVQSCIVEEFNKLTYEHSTTKRVHYQQDKTIDFIMSGKANNVDVAIKLMRETPTLLLFGNRLSGNLARYFSFMLGYLEKQNTHAFFEVELYPLFEIDKLLIIFATSNKTNYNDLIYKARSRGVKTIYISTSGDYIQNKLDNDYLIRINLPLFVNSNNELNDNILKIETLRTFIMYLLNNI